MLRECASVVESVGLKTLTDTNQRKRITAPLSAVADPNYGVFLAVEAMLRLPFALAVMGSSPPAETAFTFMLEWAVYHSDHYRLRGELTSPNLPELAVAACWSIGNLFDFSTPGGIHALGAGARIGGAAVMLLIGRILKSPSLHEDQRVNEALDALLIRLDRQTYQLTERVRLAQGIVKTRGAPRSSSKTLVALAADFARRDAARAGIRSQVGPALGNFIDNLLDGKIRESIVSKFAALPEVVAVLDQTPEALGNALVTLHRIEATAPGAFPRWIWLRRHEGVYHTQPGAFRRHSGSKAARRAASGHPRPFGRRPRRRGAGGGREAGAASRWRHQPESSRVAVCEPQRRRRHTRKGGAAQDRRVRDRGSAPRRRAARHTLSG